MHATVARRAELPCRQSRTCARGNVHGRLRASSGTMTDRELERERMVRSHIAARGVVDSRVLDAMRAVPRERFVERAHSRAAYDDNPLPIAHAQTISQPYVVAWMCEALELGGHEKVLEIGTGSGYAAAVLGRLAREVHTIERHGPLAALARARLAALGADNVHVYHGDGTLGLPSEAPFHAIVVAAGGPTVPRTLPAQLTIGGRLVIPVGAARSTQSLVRMRRISETHATREHLGDVRFVPLVGRDGWSETD